MSTQGFISVPAAIFGLTFVGFGINACIRPLSGLSFFLFDMPSNPADQKMVEQLMIVYGVRDVYMGIAMLIAVAYGTRKTLGWITIAGSAVAFADGLICARYKGGQGAHWGYAPLLTVLGLVMVLGKNPEMVDLGRKRS